MAYYFTPPTVDEHIDAGRPLNRYTLPRGVSVLVENGVFREARYPSHDEVRAADTVYLGGHRHEVTAAERTALIAAGYTVETT